MARKPAAMPEQTPMPPVEVLTAHEQINRDSANQLATLNAQTAQAAQAVALQVGYDGTLTVGALEDEIRFYQRRTVEACLELGKRLLVLRELTPHGEFEKRIEILGFEKTKAHRFMKAVSATAKSCNLQLLSTQVKNMSAFMEILMLDDDTLEDLSKLDDIDRMSASELRATVRNLRGDVEAKDKVLDDTQNKLTKLQVQVNKKIVADINWPDALIPITDQIAACKRDIDHIFSKLESARIALLQVEMSEDQRPKFEAALAHVAEVYASALTSAERHYLKDQVIFAQTLGAFLSDEEA